MKSFNSHARGKQLGALFAALFAVPLAASAATLPGINLGQYCANTYGSGAYATLKPGQNNAYGWTCVAGGQYRGMDLNTACQQQYWGSYGAAYHDYNNAYSWYCQWTTSYSTMSGSSVALYAWKGTNVALLTPDTTTCSAPEAMFLVTGIDQGYDFYKTVTARTPTSFRTYSGLASFAAVPSAYGPSCSQGGGTSNACGEMGRTGVEFNFNMFSNQMCAKARLSQYDQTPFYELGRNFWFYNDTLAPVNGSQADAFRTGYAVAMRFLSFHYTGLNPADLSGHTFSNMKTTIEGMVDGYRMKEVACGTNGSWWPTYQGSPNCYAYTFDNTLRTGNKIYNPTGYSLGNTDLFASFVLRLHKVHGRNFLNQLWRKAELRPRAYTDYQAMDNFVVAASQAAGVNLSSLFQNDWRWTVGSQAVYDLQQTLGSPVSSAPYLSPLTTTWQ